MAPSQTNAPDVDIILVFRAARTSQKSLSKQEVKEDAEAAEKEYSRLLNTLRGSGLRATGKRGKTSGQLLVFVWAPVARLAKLVQRERCILLHPIPFKAHLSYMGCFTDTQTSYGGFPSLNSSQRIPLLYRTLQHFHPRIGCALYMNSLRPRVTTAGLVSYRAARNGHV